MYYRVFIQLDVCCKSRRMNGAVCFKITNLFSKSLISPISSGNLLLYSKNKKLLEWKVFFFV